LLSSLKKKLGAGLSPSARQWLIRLRRPRVGHLPFRRTRPLSERRGWERGQPIDRFYIERFLDQNRRFIRGRCLEVKDDTYTRRFGGSQVTSADVLDIDPRNKAATVCGDLRHLAAVADGAFDCIILTQVLQYIDDVAAAVRETHRILKPDGTLLMTVPFIASVDTAASADYWRFTPDGVRALLGRTFPPAATEVAPMGGFTSTVAFLMGMAKEDLRGAHLETAAPVYASVIGARAAKSG
jgi:SAM-dependent methyltransferase